MKNQYAILRKYGLLLLDITCVVLSYYFAMGIRYHFDYTVANHFGAMFFVAVLLALVMAFDFISDSNSSFMKRDLASEFGIVLGYNCYLLLGIVLIAFFARRMPMLSRLVTAYFFIIDIVVMFVARALLKLLVRRLFANSTMQSSVLMIFDDYARKSDVRRFYPGLTYNVCGTLIISEEKVSGKVYSDHVNVGIADLTNVLVGYQIDDVFINAPSVTKQSIERLISDFQDMGANCHLALNIPLQSMSNVQTGIFGQVPVATYSLQPKKYPQLMVKRAFDIFGALVGLLITGAIAIILVPAIKLDSPGPAIFTQTRIGKNGRRFKFYKFRSMYIDAEERKAALMGQNKVTGLMFKIDDDPRITKIGKFIRATSLDELPQFLNVLKGDMSLVGTRPPTEDEFTKYSGHYKRRLSMTPGITGMWQVSGRSKITDFDEIVKLDLEYIDNWSLALDAYILGKTLGAVLRRDGAE